MSKKGKLLIAIVHPDDSKILIDELTEKKYRLSSFEVVGGFLKTKNICILIGLDDEKDRKEVEETIKKNCRSRTEFISSAPPLSGPGELVISNPVEVKVGGATIFVVDAEVLKL